MPSTCAAPTTATMTIAPSRKEASDGARREDGSHAFSNAYRAKASESSFSVSSSSPARALTRAYAGTETPALRSARHQAASNRRASRRVTKASVRAGGNSLGNSRVLRPFSFSSRLSFSSKTKPRSAAATSFRSAPLSDAKTEFNKRKLASRTEPSFFVCLPAVAVAVPFSFSPSETPSSPSTTPASVSDAGTSPSTTARAPAAIADASAATVSAPAGAFWSRRAATSSCASSEAARYARAARDVSPGIEDTERNVSATRATRVAAETFSCSFSRVLFCFVRVGTVSDGTLPESSLESFASSLE
mmetsp:Transcript_11374/g.47674  ORF Transcript_11374/g.47674 Transcript_11374/m.47674 type:complete len:304 (+) Transcript_11374:192-1103(+)